MLKTRNIKIYGASDDLIEVDGDLSDEGTAYGQGFVELSTGDVFKLSYGKDPNEPVWRIEQIVDSGMLSVRMEKCDWSEDNENESGYSDIAWMVGPITWIQCWQEWPPTMSEIHQAVESLLDYGRLSPEALKQVVVGLKNEIAAMSDKRKK